MMEKFNPLDYLSCVKEPKRLALPGAWVQHIPFAMYLVSAFKPRRIVELGTHTGNSYCAFCQAVKEQKLNTRCFAIDTWKGDPQAGYYGNDVYEELSKYHDPNYGEFSRLIRSTFDDAASGFDDHSVDLLHIDGLHTYDAVKHDFETWLPKVKIGGIVMFHDTNERQSDFGVWKLWEELKQSYPSIEFLYGHGLGVLVNDEKFPKVLSPFLKNAEETMDIREFFYLEGKKLDTMATLKEELTQIDVLRNEILSLRSSISWKVTKPLRLLSEKVHGRF